MTLTRGARIITAVLSAALALTVCGWMARDLAAVPSPSDLWLLWTSTSIADPPLTTSLDHLVLLVVHLALLVAALRPGLTVGAPAAAGAITLALWLPGLWVLGSSWSGLRTAGDLRTHALYATFAALALGMGLLITAAAGASRESDLPYRGMPLAASVLLGASAGVIAGWEIRTAAIDPLPYTDRFTGDPPALPPLLAVPPGWLTAVTVLLAAVSALAAMRPLALVAGLLVLLTGVRGVDAALRGHLEGRLGELSTGDLLLVCSSGFEAMAGAASLLLLLLARPPLRPPPLTVVVAPAPPRPSVRPPGW